MATDVERDAIPQLGRFPKVVKFRGQAIAKAVVAHLVDQGASFLLKLEHGADYEVYLAGGFVAKLETVIHNLEKKIK